MDSGYLLLILLLGFIALMVLWGVGGISPIALLRLAFGGDVMSRLGERVEKNALAREAKGTENERKRKGETGETGDRKNEKQDETFSFAEMEAYAADALARLIISGELDKTPAVKALGGKSGEAYQQKKAILDAALERQRDGPQYRPLDANRQPV